MSPCKSMKLKYATRVKELSKTEAIEILAERLHWKLEHVDPTDGVKWEELTEFERENFRICIETLLCRPDAIRVAMD